MSFVVVIGILSLLAALAGIVRYAPRHRPLAFAYSALACYSLGLLLLSDSYAYSPTAHTSNFQRNIWIRASNDARYNLLLELSWLAIVVTGVLLLFALREYTRHRVKRAIAIRETVDRLDTLPPPARKRKKRRRRRSRRGGENAGTAVENDEDDVSASEGTDSLTE